MRRIEAHVFVEDLEAPRLVPEDHHHLARVLRLAEGALVSASDGVGGVRLCRFQARQEELVPAGEPSFVPEPKLSVTVAVGLLKGDSMALAVQKLTELGVDRIILLDCERSQLHWRPGPETAARLGRLERIAREASMQSRRCRLPKLTGPVKLSELASREQVVLADRGGSELEDVPSVVAIGPEGGWSDSERGLGLPTITLSDTVLRAETAALAAATLLCALRRRAESSWQAGGTVRRDACSVFE